MIDETTCRTPIPNQNPMEPPKLERNVVITGFGKAISVIITVGAKLKSTQLTSLSPMIGHLSSKTNVEATFVVLQGALHSELVAPENKLNKIVANILWSPVRVALDVTFSTSEVAQIGKTPS